MKKDSEGMGADRVEEDTQQVAMLKQLLADARRAQQEAEQREAECHDIISALWAITDPEGASKELMARVHKVLGADDPDGHCGNAICARLRALEEERDRLQAQLAERSKG